MIGIVHAPLKPVEDLKSALLHLMDMLEYRPRLSKVLLKPNLVDATPPQTAVITDPALMEALILALRERGANEIVIAENSGFFSMKDDNFDRLLEETKYKLLIKRLNTKYGIDVPIINLERVEHVEYQWIYGKLLLPKLLQDYSYINVAKMKTHYMTGATLCVKNQKGLLKFNDKRQFHLGFGGKGHLNDCLTAYADVIQPEFNFVDATTALEGTGPAWVPEGQTAVRKLNLCIAGRDMMEVDTACCQIMGLPPDFVPHVIHKPVTLAPGSLPITPADPPFQRPLKYMKHGNFFLRTSPWGCTGCQMVFSRMLRKMTSVPELAEKLQILQKKYPKFDVYIGKPDAGFVEKADNPIIFLGNCTKVIAKELGAPHVIGCPPDHNASIELIFQSFLDGEAEPKKTT
jgi:uncharacterized protein (DUF362 family)